MKMDINEKLYEIMQRNGMRESVSYSKAVAVLKRLQKAIMSKAKVGVYGVGIECEGLLRFIEDHTDYFAIDACFDKTIRKYQYKKIVASMHVFPIEDIVDMNVDYLILGSFKNRDVFRKKFEALQYTGEIIDLYDGMEEYIRNSYTDYEAVYLARQEYEYAQMSYKAGGLKKLIKQYLLLKDFETAFNCIDEYIEN